jgi:hypothetical protein
MPIVAIEHRAARPFYYLRSFNIKFLNTMIRESVKDMDSGDKRTAKQGFLKLTYLLTLMTAANVGSRLAINATKGLFSDLGELIKELLTGEPPEKEYDVPIDLLAMTGDEILQMFFLSRYTLNTVHGLETGYNAIKDVLTPAPVSVMGDLARALDQGFKSDKPFPMKVLTSKAFRHVPLFGMPVSQSMGAGYHSEWHERELLKHKLGKVGASYSEYYRTFDKYSAKPEEARREGKSEQLVNEVIKKYQIAQARKLNPKFVDKYEKIRLNKDKIAYLVELAEKQKAQGKNPRAWWLRLKTDMDVLISDEVEKETEGRINHLSLMK